MIGGGENKDHFVRSRKIYNYVKHLNEQGRVIPILGICLGMQYIMMTESIDGTNFSEFHMSWNENRNLNFMMDPKTTVAFQHFSWEELKLMATQEYAFNSHWYGFDPERAAEDFGVMQELVLTSKSQSVWGDYFLATIEGKRIPVLGYIYHLEKPGKNYDPIYMGHLDNSPTSITLIRKHMEPFVRLARKSSQKFESYAEERMHIIENNKNKIMHNYVGIAYLFE
jgi:imidazoleglycerol phosphate synthase glutamine amidotransferase subunit HisH